MRMTASDFVSYHRPTRCDLRVFLRHHREEEVAPGPYDEVLRRLGLRHEKNHLATLGAFADVSDASLHEQVKKTADAIAKKVPILYQAAFLANAVLGGTDVEIVGVPDFLILDVDGYLIRDSKMSRRIDEDNHPEILLQVQLYGWLFEKSSGAAPKKLQVHSGTGEIVTIPYDGGRSALTELERLLALRRLAAEPYEPVGWTKCLGCGFTDRCWAQAEKSDDIALVYCVDQSLARTLHSQGVRTRKGDATALGNKIGSAESKRKPRLSIQSRRPSLLHLLLSVGTSFSPQHLFQYRFSPSILPGELPI
jgi:predicted RecB family nuclease